MDEEARRMRFAKMLYCCSVVYTGFRGWGGVPAGLEGGTFYIGEIKNFAFFQTRTFSKNVKKSMQIFIIF